MITFFVVLILLMVLLAIGIPALQGTGRRVVYERRPRVVEEIIEDDPIGDRTGGDSLEPIARSRRVVRRRRVY
ncbi:MAG TPA: hypothetical protein VFA94_11935 [Acidimicrobiales bacterium]|nr:hypothetical protein [Acidimicrobiales bacterium]